jgi:hypothetical protein
MNQQKDLAVCLVEILTKQDATPEEKEKGI